MGSVTHSNIIESSEVRSPSQLSQIAAWPASWAVTVKTYTCDPVWRCATTASLRSGAPCISSVTFAAKTSMKTAFPQHNDAERIQKHGSASSTLWATNATTSRSESLETSNLWPSCMAIASSASSVGYVFPALELVTLVSPA